MVKNMNDLDTSQIRTMKDQLSGLSYQDLKNLHDEVVEKYAEFQQNKDNSRSRESSYY